MMIGGRRACGKTTELIKVANEKHLYIVCADRNRVHFIAQTARKLGLDIPFPISVAELPLRGYMKEVLVDDVESVLYQLIRKPVLMASTSMDLKKLNFEIREGGVKLHIDKFMKFTGNPDSYSAREVADLTLMSDDELSDYQYEVEMDSGNLSQWDHIRAIFTFKNQVDGLEQQAHDMAEKHADKDIVINQLQALVESQSRVLEGFIVDTSRLVARNLVAWDTSKDKREGLLPEVYLKNKLVYKELTGDEYVMHKAIKKFNIG
jgi:hypothetical protein